MLLYHGEILGAPGVRLPELLNPAPLRDSLHRLIDFSAVHRNVRDGTLECLAFCASPTANPRNTVFVEHRGQPELPSCPTIRPAAPVPGAAPAHLMPGR
jgi:NTE family protein